MADQQVNNDIRSELKHEKSQLLEQLDDLSTDESTSLDFDENFADSGQVAAEQGENRALAGSLREQLDDVDAALGRLDNDTYGQCATCGNQISSARLEAMPAARHCINCA